MKVEQMFMMIFRYSPNPNYKPTPEDMEQMQKDWGRFFGGIAAQEKLESTHRLGFEGKQIAADSSTTEGVLISNNQMVSGNLIVKGVSLAEAIEIAKDCPILKMGGTVEVRNILPM